MGCTVSKEAATDGPSFTALGLTSSFTGGAATVSHPGDVADCSSPTATPTSNVTAPKLPPTVIRASKIVQKRTTLMVAPSRHTTQTVRTSNDNTTIQQQAPCCSVTRREGDIGEEEAGEGPPMNRSNTDAHRVFTPSVSLATFRDSNGTMSQQQQLLPPLGSGSSVHSGTSSILMGTASQRDRRERDPSLYPSQFESWGDNKPQEGRDGGSLLAECAQTINLMVREL